METHPLNSALLNSLNLGIIVLDSDLRIVFFNYWIEQRFNPSTPLTLKSKITDTLALDSRFQESLEAAKNFGRSTIITSKLNKQPFSLMYGGLELNFNLVISRFPNGDSRFILLQIVDVSQIKQREDFLIEKQKEIDHKRAESFNKERLISLGELSSSIAHEINNPLAILKINNFIVEKILMEQNALSPEMKTHILDSREVIERISKLITAIKNLARNNEGETFSNVTLKVVIQDILPVIKAKANTDHVDLQFNLDDEGFNVSIDCMRTLLGQVFVNMFNNSFYELKKLDEKWIKIQVSFSEGKAIIKFIDSGKGIPKGIRDKIFHPFYTTKDIGEGTGLGLSTSMKIIDLHSGRILVDESSPNTCLIITIPISRRKKEVA